MRDPEPYNPRGLFHDDNGDAFEERDLETACPVCERLTCVCTIEGTEDDAAPHAKECRCSLCALSAAAPHPDADDLPEWCNRTAVQNGAQTGGSQGNSSSIRQNLTGRAARVWTDCTNPSTTRGAA